MANRTPPQPRRGLMNEGLLRARLLRPLRIIPGNTYYGAYATDPSTLWVNRIGTAVHLKDRPTYAQIRGIVPIVAKEDRRREDYIPAKITIFGSLDPSRYREPAYGRIYYPSKLGIKGTGARKRYLEKNLENPSHLPKIRLYQYPSVSDIHANERAMAVFEKSAANDKSMKLDQLIRSSSRSSSLDAQTLGYVETAAHELGHLGFYEGNYLKRFFQHTNRPHVMEEETVRDIGIKAAKEFRNPSSSTQAYSGSEAQAEKEARALEENKERWEIPVGAFGQRESGLKPREGGYPVLGSFVRIMQPSHFFNRSPAMELKERLLREALRRRPGETEEELMRRTNPEISEFVHEVSTGLHRGLIPVGSTQMSTADMLVEIEPTVGFKARPKGKSVLIRDETRRVNPYIPLGTPEQVHLTNDEVRWQYDDWQKKADEQHAESLSETGRTRRALEGEGNTDNTDRILSELYPVYRGFSNSFLADEAKYERYLRNHEYFRDLDITEIPYSILERKAAIEKVEKEYAEPVRSPMQREIEKPKKKPEAESNEYAGSEKEQETELKSLYGE